MSKRRITDGGVAHVDTLLVPITQAQLAAIEEVRSLLQEAPSTIPVGFENLSPLLESLLATYGEVVSPHKKPITTRAATDLKGLTLAAALLGVDYQPGSMDFVLELKENEQEQESPEMNPHYAAVVEDLIKNQYIRLRTDEAMKRTILDLVLVDRLNRLNGMDVSCPLLLSAEVPVSVKYVDDDGKPILLKGRADWALGYGKEKKNTGSMLIIVEAKAVGDGMVGLPQMLVCMAAVHEARRDRTNKTVFGMLSDSTTYTFACLDNDKKLLVSRIFQWLFDRETILRYIDRILLDAIQSSPHTTPVKVNNTSIHGYTRYLQTSWKFHEDSDDEGDEGDENDGEGDLLDVIERDGHLFLRSKSSI